MSNSTAYEPFPDIAPNASHVKTENNTGVKTRRRKSSGLPADPLGDTSAPALATLDRDKEIFSGSSSGRTPTTTRGHKRRKAKTLFKRWARFSLRHTWVNPLILCLVGVALYLINPTSSNPMRSALFLSYPIAGTSPLEYGKGGRDFAFVAYYTIFFSFARELVMQRYLRPLAISYGLKSRAKQSRFMEQAYTAIYFFFMAPLGLYVMYRSPVWYFRTEGMYENFPHRQHEGLFKAYYLLQAAYWLQQTVVMLLGLEAPRKDYNELVLHHVITIALIWCSYRFHFAYMGIGVFFTHDVSDFFLATSKVLNYIDHPHTGPYFALFIAVWAYTRHYLCLGILYSVTTTFVTVGPFELNWETQQYKCWIAQYITFALLASLQGVNLFWFYAILRIAKRYVWDSQLADDRSVEETEEEEESTEMKRERLREAGVPSEVLGTPQVLLNGVKIEGEEEEVEAIINGKSGNGTMNGRGASGMQRVEVSGSQRTVRSRKV